MMSMQMPTCCMGVAVVVVQQQGLNQAAHLLSCAAQICTLFYLPAQQHGSPFQLISNAQL